jgi:hypothetical protein
MESTIFTYEQRENPKEGFKHKNKRKMPERETKMKIRTIS